MKVTRGTAWYSADRASTPERRVMSASATAAWYIDMWVKAPLPVMSPIAHSRSPARICASVSTERAFGSSPTASSPTSAMLGRRPAATSSRSEPSSTAVPPASVRETVNRPSAWRTEPIFAPAMTRMPSAAIARATTSEDSGSSSARMRGAASTRVTVVPKRANAWASSAPIAPPPMTTIDAGRSAVSRTSRLVQNGVSARPSTGGAEGEVPVLSTTPREAT